MSVHQIRRNKRVASALLAGVGVLSTSAGLVQHIDAGATGSTIGAVSGKVFQDFNANGARDLTSTIPNAGGGSVGVAVDAGVAGVGVRAVDDDGDVVATAVTDAAGGYTLNVVGSAAGYVRVEFGPLPVGFKEGPRGVNSGSTVQVVALGATNADLGINKPADYCQNNPNLVVSCFLTGSDTSVRAVPYSGGKAAPYPSFLTHPAVTTPNWTSAATMPGSGSTYGLGWDPNTRSLFAASFYKLNIVPTVPVLVDPPVDYTGDGYLDGSINQTIDVSPFGAAGPGAVYIAGSATPFVNLGSRAGVDPVLANPAVVLAQPETDLAKLNAAAQRQDALIQAYGTVGLGDIDVSEDGKTLFVMNLGDRKLYHVPLVGSPPAPIADSAVVSIPTSPEITTAQVPCASNSLLRPMGLGLKDGEVFIGVTCASSGQTSVLRYSPGTQTFTGTVLSFTGANTGYWLPISYQKWNLPTDIAFDGNDMLLGIREGRSDVTTNVTGTGDLLRACLSGPWSWTLEANGTCGATTTAGSGNTEGPAGGEYYYQDGGEFLEAALGSIANIAGFPDMAATTYDSFALYEGNVSWFDHSTGTRTKAWTAYERANEPNTLGKQSGLGDLEALCDRAPIEIGDRLWNDADGDGLQDPNELGIANVTLMLFAADGVTVAGRAVTDANGYYVFGGANNTNLTSGFELTPNTNYSIQLDMADPDLPTGYAVTKRVNAPATIDANSDANPAGTVSVRTGDVGSNIHTFDIGLHPLHSLGNRVWRDSNSDGLRTDDEPVAGGVAISLFDSLGTLVGQTTTDASGYYRFDRLGAGSYVVRVDASNFVGGLLAGYKETLVVPDPNSDVNNDSNGLATVDAATTGVSSGVIVLGGGEPLGEADTSGVTGDAIDSRSNLSVDFGFVLVPVTTTTLAPIDATTTSTTTTTATTTASTTTTPATTTTTTAVFDSTSTSMVPTTTAAPTATVVVPVVAVDPASTEVLPTTTTPATTTPTSTSNPIPTTTTPATTTSLPVANGNGVVVGTVFLDRSRDGKRDQGEGGTAASQSIQLVDASGKVIATTVVSSDGSFRFVQIPPGKYSVVLSDSIVAVDVNSSGTSSEADVPIVTEVDELSLTGSNATELLVVGFVLIGAGLLLAVGRRRTPR
jgi:hypothetical protein